MSQIPEQMVELQDLVEAYVELVESGFFNKEWGGAPFANAYEGMVYALVGHSAETVPREAVDRWMTGAQLDPLREFLHKVHPEG